MGMVFGKTGVSEPDYSNILSEIGSTPYKYDIREYGVRYSVCTDYSGSIAGSNGDAFRKLANYIGVYGKAQNKPSQSISMTAPVETTIALSSSSTNIAMTAPVETTNLNTETDKCTMCFMLPAEYNNNGIDKVPVPTSSDLYLVEKPASSGAVYQFSGSVDDKTVQKYISEFTHQISQDLEITDNTVLSAVLWQYHPPFTLPFLRRNEIFVELNQQQIDKLKDKYTNKD